jgi:hypothetical protein
MEVSGQLHSGRFTPRERAPGTHWIGGWVGPRARLDAVVKRKIPSPYRDSNPPIVQRVAQLCTTEPSRLLRSKEWDSNHETKIVFKTRTADVTESTELLQSAVQWQPL